jgi:hypothetical protein
MALKRAQAARSRDERRPGFFLTMASKVPRLIAPKA